MTSIAISKKLNKLIRHPNLFFYDFFRKRVFINAPENAKKTIEKAQSQVTPSIDIMEINRLGIANYIKKHLNTGVAPEDGFDKNGLLVWSGYLNGLMQFIFDIKAAMSMDISIYTLGGGYNVKVASNEEVDYKAIIQKLKSRPDFIIEMSNELGILSVIHFYLYDINEDGVAIIRSNRALIRKCFIHEIEQTFSICDTTYNEKIDAVYTWVNQADPNWQKMWLETFPDVTFDPDRFTSNDELKYSLRSLNKFAPWLNKIYIVSNCCKPQWLSDNAKIKWVDHKEIFPHEKMLPTFNSHAIECCLHKIDGLSERFIYLNDDFVLSQPCLPCDFFDEIGRSVSYFEPYGMVNINSKKEDQPDYLQAAKNSYKLIKEKFPNYNARNLHRHVPYALRKSILEKIEDCFPKQFSITRNAKIRSSDDINLTSFLYHHFSYASGQAVKSDLTSLIVRPENIKALLNKDSYKYKILCFNDGNGSSNNLEYKKHTEMFFRKRLSESAIWENNSKGIQK